MGTVDINVHRSKLLYATILKALGLWEQIRFRKDILSEMFPAIDTQWAVFKKVISPGISRKVAVTASLSKASTVPDETRVPPSVDINGETIRLMNRLASSMGLTLNTTDYEWNDEAEGYRRAMGTWASAINAYLEIEQIANDLTMHRAYGSDLYVDADDVRTPGQLTFYEECNVPLADCVIFVDELSRIGLNAGFGDLYLGWLMLSIDALVADAPPTIETSIIDVTATPQDCPAFPGEKTRYAFSAPDGWSLGGAVIAASPSLAAPSVFYHEMAPFDPEGELYRYGIWYGSASAGALYVAGAYNGGTVPAAVEFRLLLIRTV